MGSPHFGGVAWGQRGCPLHIMSAQRLLISHAIPHHIIRCETCSTVDTDQAIGTDPQLKKTKHFSSFHISFSLLFFVENR
jgi:hypothetical protein